jgi:hypothetical protein
MIMIQVAANEPKMDGVVRVLVSIPTMGYCHVQAYCNRLINFMHMGKLEERGKAFIEAMDAGLNPSGSMQTGLIDNGSGFKRFEFLFAVIGRIFTPVAREEAAKLCLEWNCDYLYMIDDDMICPDTMFEQLYAHNVDIIAPLAFTRNYPHKPVIYSCVEGYDQVSKKDYFMNTTIMNYPKDKLVECDAVGFGAVLIKRHVLEKMETPRFMSTCGTGEDILFCYKAKKSGFRVYMDTACKLGHLSHPINVDEDYVEKNVRALDPGFYKRNSDYSSHTNGRFDSKDRALCVLGDRYAS